MESGKPCETAVYLKETAKFWMDQSFHFLIYGDPADIVGLGSRRMMDEVQKLLANSKTERP